MLASCTTDSAVFFYPGLSYSVGQDSSLTQFNQVFVGRPIRLVSTLAIHSAQQYPGTEHIHVEVQDISCQTVLVTNWRNSGFVTLDVLTYLISQSLI